MKTLSKKTVPVTKPQRGVIINVGPYEYRVRISAKPLFHDGKKAAGLALWDQSLILICGSIPRARWAEVLFHEVIEAWIFHVGKPTEKEALIDWAGTVHASMNKDIAMWGGIEALHRLRPAWSKLWKSCTRNVR